MSCSFYGEIEYRNVLETANLDFILSAFEEGLKTHNPILGVPAMEDLFRGKNYELVVKTLAKAFDKGQLKAGSAMLNAIANSLFHCDDPILEEYASAIGNGFLGSPRQWIYENACELEDKETLPGWVKKELEFTTE